MSSAQQELSCWDGGVPADVLISDLGRSEAFYAFHHVNAFEDGGGNIAVDIMAADDLSIAKTFKLKHLRKGTRPFSRVMPKR